MKNATSVLIAGSVAGGGTVRSSVRSSLFVLFFVLAFGASAPSAFASTTTWNVPGDNSGTCTIDVSSCATIQAAVTAAGSGDTIIIAAGNYPENVKIFSKTGLTIQGAGKGDGGTLINGNGNGYGIEIDNSSNLTIKDLKIVTSGPDLHGIYVDGNYVSGRGVSPSNNLTIQNTTIIVQGTTDHEATGIYADYVTDGPYSGWTITGNTITADGGGIGLEDVTNSTVSNNVSTITNGTNILWLAVKSDLSSLVVSGNTVNGSGGSQVSFLTDYHDGLADKTISGVTVSGNTFENWGTKALNLGTNVTGITINSNTFEMTKYTSLVIGGTDTDKTSTEKNIFNVHSPAKIQTAVDTAFSGDTINVASGTYDERVLINKSLTIVGSGVTKPIITGLNSDQYIVKVDGTSGVVLNNIEISGYGKARGENAFDYGVWVNHSGTSNTPVELKNLTVKNVWKTSGNGIEVDSGSYALVHDNTISLFDKRGIRFINSTGKFYSNEVIGETADGISRVQNLVNLWGGSTVEIYLNKLHDALITGLSSTWTSPAIQVSAYDGASSNTPSHANVHNNEIYSDATGIVVGSASAADGDASTATITNNNFHDLVTGINFEQGTITATITGNSFSNISSVAVDATVSCNDSESGCATSGVTASTVTDLTHNYWGQATGPVTGEIATSTITSSFSPYFTNVGMTTLSDNTAINASYSSTVDGQADLPTGQNAIELTNNTVLDVLSSVNTVSGDTIIVAGDSLILSSFTSGDLSEVNLSTPQTVGDKTVDVAQAVQLSSSNGAPIVLSNSELPNVSVSILDGTTILAPSEWDGTIAPPTTSSDSSGSTPSGFSVGGTIIDVGADVVLLFDKAVKITLTGVTGTVGYKPAGSDNWKTITTQCTGVDTPGINFPGECSISDGLGNTIIWTYHFTSFGEMIPDPTPTPTPGHGGGNACGLGFTFNSTTLGCDKRATPATPAVPGVNPAVPATPAQGRGQVLGASTFNFTRDLGVGLSGADVTELQKVLIDAGILKINAPTGNFGQLTKAAVQAFQKSHGVSETGYVGPLTRSELNKGVTPTATNLTPVQADAILSLLESFGADASVVAKVRASLGR